MKSLFVVSLPRSLSTTLYYAASRALALREPNWTTGGEILNRERTRRVCRRGSRATNARFTVRDAEPDLFARVGERLGATVETEGYAYKDVVQPFVVAEWLDPAEFRVLKIERDVAEVAYAMIKRRWHYPGGAASLHRAHPWSLIEGLLRAESVLAALPGETVRYAEAVASHEPLRDALSALYPERPLAPIAYIDRRFERTRAKLEHRRESELFCQLQRTVDEVRATLAGHAPAALRPALAGLEVLSPLSAAAST
jgi:hypothetical protein